MIETGRIKAGRIMTGRIMTGRRALLAAPALLLGREARAEGYPSRPITFIVQFGPGSSSDILVRRLAEPLSAKLGQPIVVTNKTGGGGSIGVGEIARSAPDGYTIGLVTMPTLAIIPHLRRVPYDPLNGFHHIGVIQPIEYALYCTADSPLKTWEDLVAHARANPGKLAFGSPGPGTTNHLVTERIARDLGLSWTHVPFRGGDADVFANLIGGHIQFANGSRPAVEAQVKAGRMRPLLITSRERWDGAPEVPTMMEKGFGYYQASFFSLAAPAGIPEAAKQRLDAAAKAVLTDPALIGEMKERLSAKIVYQDGPSYAQVIREMHAFYRDFLPKLGLS